MNKIISFLANTNATVLDTIIVSILVLIISAILTKLWYWFYKVFLNKIFISCNKRFGKYWRYVIFKPNINDLIEIEEIPKEKRTKKQKKLLHYYQSNIQKYIDSHAIHQVAKEVANNLNNISLDLDPQKDDSK